MQPLYGRLWIIIADYDKMEHGIWLALGEKIGELYSEKRRG